MIEIWKKIPDAETEASTLGRIRKVDTHKIIKSHDCKGYEIVSILYKGTQKRRKVHRLVMLAHVGYSSLQVNHRDRNKRNNRLTNLEYMTCKQNIHHAMASGVKYGGPKPQKLDEIDVLSIRSLYQTGLYKQEEIAQVFGVTRPMVTYVVNYKTWKGVA